MHTHPRQALIHIQAHIDSPSYNPHPSTTTTTKMQAHTCTVCLERQFSPLGSTQGDTTNRPDQTRQPADR